MSAWPGVTREMLDRGRIAREAAARTAMVDWLAAVMAGSQAKAHARGRVRRAVRELGHTPAMGRMR